MEVTRRARLYGWTLANMRHQQLFGVVERAGRNHLLPALPVDVDARYERNPPPVAALRTGPVESNLAALRASLSADTRATYRERAADAADGDVRFLNETVDVAGDPVAWDADALADLPRLWRLKLHGFEPLAWFVGGYDPDGEIDHAVDGGTDYAVNDETDYGMDDEASHAVDDEASHIPNAVDGRELVATFEAWIADWLDSHPVGERAHLRRAWAPYAVSKRVEHWSRFCAWQRAAGLAPSAVLRAGIRKNATFLASHVERDVGGNHVVENGRALVTAGTVLPDGDRLVRRGLDVLADAADEQFLADGGHYERSPMYHVEVLSAYLTVLDLCARSGHPRPDAIDETARAGLAFLETLAPPDDRIPLLNDAVFGETLSLPAVRRYANRVDGVAWPDGRVEAADGTVADRTAAEPDAPPGGADRLTGRALADSGYYWLGGMDSRMLVDGGPVGPPHLPGHSHNDLLSVMLWVDGQRVIADTGTYSYEPGERRQYARGVRGHSTVQVGTQEPIELGGRFLMGERTAPQTTFRPGTVDALRGQYTTPCGYGHARRVYGTDSWWLVWDRVSGAEGDHVRSRLTVHPDVEGDVTDDGTAATLTGPGGETIAWVYPIAADRITRSQGWYFPRFGEKRPRDVLQIHRDGPQIHRDGPATETGSRRNGDDVRKRGDAHADGFGYVITTSPQESVAVDVTGAETTTIELGSTTLEVPSL